MGSSSQLPTCTCPACAWCASLDWSGVHDADPERLRPSTGCCPFSAHLIALVLRQGQLIQGLEERVARLERQLTMEGRRHT